MHALQGSVFYMRFKTFSFIYSFIFSFLIELLKFINQYQSQIFALSENHLSHSRNKNGTKNTKKVLRFNNKQLFDTTHSQNSLLEANDEQLEELNTKKPVYYSCLDIECEAGGVCIMDESHADKRIRCKCPLGRGGFFCEKRKFCVTVSTDTVFTVFIFKSS